MAQAEQGGTSWLPEQRLAWLLRGAGGFGFLRQSQVPIPRHKSNLQPFTVLPEGPSRSTSLRAGGGEEAPYNSRETEA